MAAPQREKAWTDFHAWCLARGLRPLPAHPWTVAAYVRFCQGRHRMGTIRVKVETIVRAHVLGGHASPGKSLILKRTLKSIAAAQPAPSRRRSLFSAADFLDGADEGTVPAPAKTGKAGAKGLSASPRLARRKRA